MTNYTLCLVDTNSRRRAGIAHLLCAAGLHVEPFESPSELVEQLPKGTKSVFVHDDGVAIAKILENLLTLGSDCAIVAYDESPELPRVVRTMKMGADHYLEWPFSVRDAREAITAALASQQQSRHSHLRERIALARVERLTMRERQVLARLADGLSNRGIAERLQISPRTVEIHRANMLQKISARHTSEAIRVALEANLMA